MNFLSCLVNIFITYGTRGGRETMENTRRTEEVTMDYETEYHRMRKEIYALEEENKKLVQAIVKIALMLE